MLRSYACVVLVVTLLLSGGAPAGGLGYQPPVPGPVTVPFEETDPFAPGHRGVDLEAVPGQQVRAAAAGTVVFAGAVAGPRWVVIDHPDGLRTSYGPLGGVRVAVGGSVTAGAVLGRVVAGHIPGGPTVLHFGVRRGGTYLDPAGLLGGAWRPTLVGPGGWQGADEPDVPRYEPWDGEHSIWMRAPESPTATGPGWLIPPNPNHVVGVAGFNSHSGSLPIDLEHLGYAPEDVTYLSYTGRADGLAAADDPLRDQLPYDQPDTWQSIHESALLLRDQLRVQWQRSPGQAVDLVGHSQGGVVVMYYLLTMHDPADPTLPPIGHAATFASPLDGNDLASLIVTARKGVVGRSVLAELELALGTDPDAPAITDLATGSDVIEAIGDGWGAARRDVWSSPLATGTQVMTFGADFDVFVPPNRTDLPDGEHVVLPGGHSRVRDTEAARIALRAFLADEPVPGESGGWWHAASYAFSAAGQALRPAVLAADALLLRPVPLP